MRRLHSPLPGNHAEDVDFVLILSVVIILSVLLILPVLIWEFVLILSARPQKH